MTAHLPFIGSNNAASYLSDTLGRRLGVAIGVVIILVGTIIQCVPAVNSSMFIGGRFLVGLGYVFIFYYYYYFSS